MDAREIALGVLRRARRVRLIGLSGEVAFFVLLSLPPLALAIGAALGFVSEVSSEQASFTARLWIQERLAAVAGERVMDAIVRPGLAQLFQERRPLLLAGALVFGILSASKAARALIRTLAITTGRSREERRSFLRRALTSVLMTAAALGVLAVFLPLVAGGPALVRAILPVDTAWFVTVVYWIAAGTVAIGGLATLYHWGEGGEGRWVERLPGATLAAATWAVSALALRLYLLRGSTMLGPLSGLLGVLVWLYVFSAAILLGAALNTEMWPGSGEARTGNDRRKESGDETQRMAS